LVLIFPCFLIGVPQLTFGGLLSATDPVAVVALLKELGASKKLNTIIEGESLMNDG
jgi:NhaP-type Na+/H+ or K+/H+ antiporter